MSYKNLLIIFCIIFIFGCEQHKVEKKINIKKIEKKSEVKKEIIKKKYLSKYRNTGFTLVYSGELNAKNKITKKIDSRSLLIFHNKLKKNSFVKITNPINEKTIVAKVMSNDVEYSNFYNSVITSRIAEELSLNLDEPYIDIFLISENSTFIAKKAKTFEEEKNVAEKAPIDGIEIDNLGNDENIKKEIVKITKFKYSIKVADFYYEDSAKNMINRILNETNIKEPLIKKLTKTKYRVLLGPFNDIKKLEESFNEIKSLNFENLEILKNV